MPNKGLIRSLNRQGTRSEKSPTPGITRRTPGPILCPHCAALFARKTWRHDHKVTFGLLDRASWRACPACRQTRGSEGFGKVVLRGDLVTSDEDAIRRRIQNVAARASYTQPERRLVTIERAGDELEVLTTSQKLAHRVARELKKAFGGRTTYAWSDVDGSLVATWEGRRTTQAARTRRPGARARG
jgi:NMD protein affecting ribosome stability and mRNA decay